jgi:hypothetical protein
MVVIACGCVLVFATGAASGHASSKVRACGKVRASGGGPPSAMPSLLITVQGGSVSCANARLIIGHFQSLITQHAKISGYSCTQINTAGDERCVRGKTVIKGTYPK